MLKSYASDVPALLAGAGGTTEQQEQAASFRRRAAAHELRLLELRDAIERKLIALGTNPSGPDDSRQSRKSRSGIAAGRHSSTSQRTAHRARLRHARQRITVVAERGPSGSPRGGANLVFAARRRDFESIGLGTVTIDPTFTIEHGDLDRATVLEVIDATVRILGTGRRRPGKKDKGSDDPPTELKRFWAAVAKRHDIAADDLAHYVAAALTARVSCASSCWSRRTSSSAPVELSGGSVTFVVSRIYTVPADLRQLPRGSSRRSGTRRPRQGLLRPPCQELRSAFRLHTEG